MGTVLTDKTSVKAVIAQMTLEEKATVVTGGSTFGSAPIERLGIPAALLIDAGCGVNLRQYIADAIFTGKIEGSQAINGSLASLSQLVFIMDRMGARDELNGEENALLDRFLAYLKTLVPSGEMPSCFPVNSLLASTWDPETVLDVARHVGREANAFGVDMLLGTTCINIQRDPRGGRGFEGYSEDPYLISELAPMYALGVQGEGVIADVKHYALNNQETDRQTVNVVVSQRAMREIYFPGFKAAVQKGGVKNVMTSYNWINGEASAHNRWLIEDVLRGEWGFKGYVVSDWGGVYDQVAAIRAGNDLCMPGPRSIEPIVKAVKSGELDEALLDKCVENFLNVLVEMPVIKGRKYFDIDSEASRRSAYRAAVEGIVLLKNENGALPLSRDTRAAFFGPRSVRFNESGVGSGRVHTTKTSSMTEEAVKIAGTDKVSVEAFADGSDAAVITVFAAGQEGADREDIALEPAEAQRIHTVATEARARGAKVILILNVAGPVELGEFQDEVDAILLVYFPGQEGGRAAADILYGLANPSGKLAQTFPKLLRDCPAYGNFPGENKTVYYGEGIYVGYRHYDARGIEPMYPFGHGLSYTTFELSNLRLAGREFFFDVNDKFPVSVTVKNTGTVAGAQVVQLYLSDERSTRHKPPKELKAFKKVFLEPGEKREVTLEITRESLCSFDEEMGEWVCEPGRFRALVGTSSRDIILCGSFAAVGRNPYGYGQKTQYVRIARDERALKMLLDSLPEGVLTRDDVVRQTVYIGFSFTLEQAFEKYIRPRLDPAKARGWFDELCRKLESIDVTDSGFNYRETEIY